MGKKKGFGKGFKRVIGLGLFLIAFGVVMLVGQPVIDAVPLFHILMTLGGLETYNDTVFGIFILILLVGIVIIAVFED